MKLITIVVSLLLFAGVGLAAHQETAATATTTAPANEKAVIEAQLPSYPVEKCAIMGVPFTEKKPARNVVVENRLVRVCCPKCEKTVKKDPAKAFAAIDAEVVKAQQASYPVKTCVVGGGELGSRGTPIEHVHGTRLVRLCCKGCVPKFEKEPAKYMAMVDQALIEAQTKSYPVKTCVVGGGELGSMGDPVDYLHGTRLVRFCCKGCVPAFKKEPAKYLAMLDKAMPAKKAAAPVKKNG